MRSLKINRLLPIYIIIVPFKFGVDIESQTKVGVRKPKYPIWPQDGHFESDVSENQLAPTHIYISIVPLKSGVDIQSQTKLRVRKQKDPIRPPGGHFEMNIAENQ